MRYSIAVIQPYSGRLSLFCSENKRVTSKRKEDSVNINGQTKTKLDNNSWNF